MDNLSHLNHLIAYTQMSHTSSGQGGVLDQEDLQDNLPTEPGHAEQHPYPDPFAEGNRFNQLDGSLNEGIEMLLPNPVTRHKLAHMRYATQADHWRQLKTWVAKWPLPDTFKQKIQAKNQLVQTKLADLEKTLAQDARQQYGVLGYLARFQKPPTQPPLSTEKAAAMLWQLAETPEEKAGLLQAMMD